MPFETKNSAFICLRCFGKVKDRKKMCEREREGRKKLIVQTKNHLETKVSNYDSLEDSPGLRNLYCSLGKGEENERAG